MYEIQFRGHKELLRALEKTGELILQNAQVAVTKTVLLGVTLIANATPVDTGRLKSSIVGEFAAQTGQAVAGPGVAEGKRHSLTRIDGLTGVIGTNVDYAAHVEYGRRIYRRVGSRRIVVGTVAPRAMFRSNIPRIRKYFNEQMREAVRAALKGEKLG